MNITIMSSNRIAREKRQVLFLIPTYTHSMTTSNTPVDMGVKGMLGEKVGR